MLFSEEDEKYLRQAGEVLQDQIEEVLDLWYSYVGSHPHLAYHFSDLNHQLHQEYLAAVRKRFHQWILYTCNRPYDQDWLNYQRIKENQTDNVQSASTILGYAIYAI